MASKCHLLTGACLCRLHTNISMHDEPIIFVEDIVEITCTAHRTLSILICLLHLLPNWAKSWCVKLHGQTARKTYNYMDLTQHDGLSHYDRAKTEGLSTKHFLCCFVQLIIVKFLGIMPNTFMQVQLYVMPT